MYEDSKNLREDEDSTVCFFLSLYHSLSVAFFFVSMRFFFFSFAPSLVSTLFISAFIDGGSKV